MLPIVIKPTSTIVVFATTSTCVTLAGTWFEMIVKPVTTGMAPGKSKGKKSCMKNFQLIVLNLENFTRRLEELSTLRITQGENGYEIKRMIQNESLCLDFLITSYIKKKRSFLKNKNIHRSWLFASRTWSLRMKKKEIFSALTKVWMFFRSKPGMFPGLYLK